MKIKILFLIAHVLFITSVNSNENQVKLLKVYKNLRCLVCQGQSIADSNSDFAATIKLVVQDQINIGKNKDELYRKLLLKKSFGTL